MSVTNSSISSTSRSISEVAGERLYQNAQKQQEKLENAILQAATVHNPKLELVASRNHSDEERDSNVPRYLKLYEDGLRRKEESQDRDSYNLQERMSESSGSLSSSSKSTSIAASERLYQQAREKQNRLEDAILEANNVRPKLVLVASKGRGLQNEDSSVPRYLHLYQNGLKNKMESKVVPEKEEKIPKLSGNNSRCDRLYALSSSKQKEGKKRREQIEKSKVRPPPPVFKKIPLSQATRMYERSMQHLISKEMKLMDVAHENSKRYESLLVPQSGINS